MKKIIIILFLIFLITLTSCSYRYLHRPFSEFSGAANLIGKNTIYVLEQLQKEEITLRIAEAAKKDTLTPEDLLPRVLTAKHLELRKELIKYIFSYTELLESLIIKDHNSNIINNANKVKLNLKNISRRHYDFLSKNEIGIITAVAGAVPAALTSVGNRKFVLKLMRHHDPVVAKICGNLKEELQAAKLVINNFYSRLFKLTAAEPWPENEKARGKYAARGSKILQRKSQINIILDDLINAIGIIPPTHSRLLKYVKTNKGPLRTLSSLVDAAARIKSTAWDFTEEEKTDEKK